ncbi:NUDIX hydrolase [Candidatus Collierbacteria bacterium]|nr:NUDIX hydrolase [Candidatus Collierbacteria bacterium]
MKSIIKQEIVYEGIFIKVRHDTVRVKNCEYVREIIESNTGVLIAAIDNRNRIVLVKQNRHNHGDVYEVPAGAIKENESPRQAAKRELLEETGIKAQKWRLISTHHNGVHNEGLNYFFLARDLSTAKNSPDQDEQISGLKFFRFDQINGLIDQELIPDLRNRACIWKAQLEIN